MLRFSHHPNIVTLHDVYEDLTHVYLFMELLTGGELLDRILSLKFFSEKEASAVIEVLTRTVKFLHENGVSSRNVGVLLNSILFPCATSVSLVCNPIYSLCSYYVGNRLSIETLSIRISSTQIIVPTRVH